jgi:uncharacterized membrane protein
MSLAVVNPFDPKTVLLAKHAQHVVLVHFPIALFLTAVGFDVAAQWTKKPVFATVARYNMMIAAIATLPVMLTGLLAWQWQLEGHKLKGILLQHLVLGVTSSMLIGLVWWMHRRASRIAFQLPVELLAAVMLALTAHLGGFLSGINTPR